MVTLTKKQASVIAVMAVVAAVMLGSPMAVGSQKALAWGHHHGGCCGGFDDDFDGGCDWGCGGGCDWGCGGFGGFDDFDDFDDCGCF